MILNHKSSTILNWLENQNISDIDIEAVKKHWMNKDLTVKGSISNEELSVLKNLITFFIQDGKCYHSSEDIDKERAFLVLLDYEDYWAIAYVFN